MFHQLNSVLTYTRDFITLNDLLNLYQQLINQYQEATNEPNNEEKIKAFQDTKQKIINIHNLVNYSSWSAPKLKILERIGASSLISESATNTIAECFSEFAGAKTIEGLNNFRGQTEQLLNKVNQTIANLSLTEEARLEDSPEGLVEITFTEEAYQNFWKLGKRSENWQYIFNLFSRVTHENFESVRIVSVASGSDMATLWTGAKNIIGMVIKAGKAVIELKKLKDAFFKDKAELTEKYGLQRQTVRLVVGERKTKFENEYEEQKSLLSLKIVKEYRGGKKDDGENENELASAVGMGIEKMVLESETGVNILNPKEIKPIEAPTPDSLGFAYKEEKKLAKEVSQMIENEEKANLLRQERTMRKELVAQIEETGLPSLEQVKKEEAEKDQKKPSPKSTAKLAGKKDPSEKKTKIAAAEIKIKEPKK